MIWGTLVGEGVTAICAERYYSSPAIIQAKTRIFYKTRPIFLNYDGICWVLRGCRAPGALRQAKGQRRAKGSLVYG